MLQVLKRANTYRDLYWQWSDQLFWVASFIIESLPPALRLFLSFFKAKLPPKNFLILAKKFAHIIKFDLYRIGQASQCCDLGLQHWSERDLDDPTPELCNCVLLRCRHSILRRLGRIERATRLDGAKTTGNRGFFHLVSQHNVGGYSFSRFAILKGHCGTLEM